MVIRTRLPESAIRWPQAVPLKPPNTSEWMTPSRAQASMVTGSSATMGMCSVTRSPADAVVRGVQLAAGEPLIERRRARVQRRVPGLVPGQQVGVLLEAVRELVLGEPVPDGRVRCVGLLDELWRRRVDLLLAPVNCDLCRVVPG